MEIPNPKGHKIKEDKEGEESQNKHEMKEIHRGRQTRTLRLDEERERQGEKV